MSSWEMGGCGRLIKWDKMELFGIIKEKN